MEKSVNSKPKEERNWAFFSHLGSLIFLLGIPFANIIVPLVIWQLKKDKMSFASSQALESLNFQITMTLYLIFAVLLCFVIIGFFILAILLPVMIILTIIAAVKSGNGKDYKYPLSFRFVK